MWKFRLLKALRVLISLLVLAWFLAGFSSLAVFAGEAVKAEFLPSLLRALIRFSLVSLAFSAVILGAALLVGRLYCSFCCPLGVLQDIAARIGRVVSFGRFRYKTEPERKRLRYIVLIVVVAAALGGWIFPLGMLEPYTLFGRNANGPGQALLIETNNHLYGRFDSLTPLEKRPEFPLFPALLGGGLLLAVLGAAAYRGRVFCNTFCPAGTLLGLCSKHALFPVRLDSDSCMKCGQCLKVCKTGCIDVRNRTLDAERCVDCMNCGTVCRFGAIRFGRAPAAKAAEEPGDPAAVDAGRRSFLVSAGGAGIAAFLAGRLVARDGVKRDFSDAAASPVMPPGAGNRAEFLSRCTGCGLCIANCTGRTLKPAFLEYGLAGMGQPVLSFEVGKCEFDCRNCSALCPTGALRKLSEDEKHNCQIGTVRFSREHCVVVTDGTSCGACAEHCPTGALQMVPYKDHLTIPLVIEELCIGCGACQYICPGLWGDGKKAMMVYGADRQGRAADPHKVLKKPEGKPSTATEEFPF